MIWLSIFSNKEQRKRSRCFNEKEYLSPTDLLLPGPSQSNMAIGGIIIANANCHAGSGIAYLEPIIANHLVFCIYVYSYAYLDVATNARLR